MVHQTYSPGHAAEADNDGAANIDAEDVEGVSMYPNPTYADSYHHNQADQHSGRDRYGYGDTYSGGTCTGVVADGDGADGDEDSSAAAAPGDCAVYAMANGGHGQAAGEAYGIQVGSTTSGVPAYSLPEDPEGTLSRLQRQRQDYRLWISQVATAALSTAFSSYNSSEPYGSSCLGNDGVAADPSAGVIPDEVPGLIATMDVAGTVRLYLMALKTAAELVRDAVRDGANFEALSLPATELYDDASQVAASEAAEVDFINAAYGVTAAVAKAREHLDKVAEMAGSPAAALVAEVLEQEHDRGGKVSEDARRAQGATGANLLAPLAQKLERVGTGLCRRLRQEADVVMAAVHWPPPLADGGAGTPGLVGAGAEGGPGEYGGAAFRGFPAQPLQSRRLVGILTALTHYQMAVEQRETFYSLLTSRQGLQTEEGGGSDGVGGATDTDVWAIRGKPLLWAAQVLAEPVAAKLRAHFHPAAPTGRLDRPAWLYCTVLEFVRQHAHALADLDVVVGCLQLKPHYNMPAEFTRALQESVLGLLRDLRIPAILELRKQAEAVMDTAAAAATSTSAEANGVDAAATADVAEADALLLSLMDASAAYDIALLPLLGATGPRVEADAAKALAMLSAASSTGGAVLQRRRACDQFEPAAAGTPDMHARYVAAAAASGPAASSASPLPSLLHGWTAAEGAVALKATEAVVYDDSSLAPAEEVAARALGSDLSPYDDFASGATGLRGGGSSFSFGFSTDGRGGGSAPWQRDTWPPLMAREVATLLDGLVARSKWLSADAVLQRDFLEAAAGPMLTLLRRRLGRLVDQAVSRGEVVSEDGLPRVCAALCAAHFLDDHLQSLLLTDLAPLVEALNVMAAAAASTAVDDAAGTLGASGTVTPSSSFTIASAALGGSSVPPGKLGGGGGGFWSGLIAAAAGGANAGVASSPARVALRDGVTALPAVAGTGAVGATGLASAAGAVVSATAPVLGDHVRAFARLHRDGCLKVAKELALGFGRCSVAYRHAIEANPQFPFTPESDLEGDGDVSEADGGGSGTGGGANGDSFSGGWMGLSRPASSITPVFTPALLFLQTSLERLSRCCDKATFADVWRGAALSINRFMFNFIATESRFTRAGARQFAADVAGLAQLFTPYSRRGGGTPRPGSFSVRGPAVPLSAAVSSPGSSGGAGGQHFRELQAAARLLCLGDEEAADVMRRASAAAVAAQTQAQAAAIQPGSALAASTSTSAFKTQPSGPTPAQSQTHTRGDPVRSGMSADPILSSSGLACLSPLQIMNVIEHRI